MRYILTTLIMLVLNLAIVLAQDHLLEETMRKCEHDIEQGYVVRDRARVVNARALLERLLAADQNDTNAQYYLAFAEYRLALFEKMDSDAFELLVDQAIERTAPLLKAQPKGAEPRALLSFLYGLKISRNIIRVPFLAPKYTGLSEESVSIDSTNPRAWLSRGLVKFNTPSICGGIDV